MIQLINVEGDKIIRLIRKDDVSLNQVLVLIEELGTKFINSKYLLILEFVGDSELSYTINDHSTILNKIKSYADQYEFIRHAIVVKKPIETAMGFLFEKLSLGINNYSFRTFSSETVARDWLLR